MDILLLLEDNSKHPSFPLLCFFWDKSNDLQIALSNAEQATPGGTDCPRAWSKQGGFSPGHVSTFV